MQNEAKVLKNIQNELAASVSRAIRESGLSQNEVCRRAQLSTRTLDQILHARGNPTIQTVARLAAALGKGNL